MICLKNIITEIKICKMKENLLVAPAVEQVPQLYSPLASDMHFVRDIAFGSDMRYARLK